MKLLNGLMNYKNVSERRRPAVDVPNELTASDDSESDDHFDYESMLTVPEDESLCEFDAVLATFEDLSNISDVSRLPRSIASNLYTLCDLFPLMVDSLPQEYLSSPIIEQLDEIQENLVLLQESLAETLNPP